MPCKNGMVTLNTKSAQPAIEANICDALCTFLNIWRLVRGRCDWNLRPTCQISRPTGAGPIHWDVWLTLSFLVEFVHTAARRPKQCRRAALCKTYFNRYLSNGCSNKKNKKSKSTFFNFASGRTLPTHSTGPQPIQLVPKHCFLQISR